MIPYLMNYLIALNLIGFLSMGADKSRAKRHAWRIPERVLIMIAILGGSIGSLAGMYLFRHKTRHAKFTCGIPFILILQIAALIFLGRFLHL